MTDLQKINEQNKHLEIKPITDESFSRYGKLLDVDAREMLGCLDGRAVDKGYCMSDPRLEKTSLFSELRNTYYGGMPIQAGICAGDNTRLNCLEYHRGAEINIAATDMILFLAFIGNMKDNSIDSRMTEAFYVPEGICILLFETSMHFAPLSFFKKGFTCIVLLPKGTNGELDGCFEPRTSEDRLLFKKNKWLIGHAESDQVRNKEAFCGIQGENISITPLEEKI